ncbi:Translocon-associated protein subunit alpha [Bagarius yarrelli]|uniref:Translocon-associated protein subunit alpha n=1 Tax=Bagarius yarrelli TaxID=175774 RepID=A0A556VWJ8_BAGYA|nr:Translocon-associated protein subunit alpha [Bagarius yarrelli]
MSPYVSSLLMSFCLLMCPLRLAHIHWRVYAEPEDEVSDEAPDVAVEEDEEDEDEEEVLVEESQTGDGDYDDDDVDEDVTSHPDADTTILFITGEDFPANELVKFLVGFSNKGSRDFTVRSLEASFPQPMAGRPFGLVILLNYQDSEGNVFQSTIFNQTVNITELDDGLDGETMFMYVFLGGLIFLMLFGMYQVLESRTRKRIPVKVETGTGAMNNVDISWIPLETLNAMSEFYPTSMTRQFNGIIINVLQNLSLKHHHD